MILAQNLRLNERLLGVHAGRTFGVDRPRETELDRKANALERRDQRAAGVEELLDRVDTRLAKAAADVVRLAIHAEELELWSFLIRLRASGRRREDCGARQVLRRHDDHVVVVLQVAL